MGSVTLFLYQKLVGIAGSFLFSVSRFFFSLFSFISSFLFSHRLQGNGGCLSKKLDSLEVIPKEINSNDSKSLKSEAEMLELEPVSDDNDEVGFTESEDDHEGKKHEFSFTFKFPTFEEFNGSKNEDNQLLNFYSVPSTIYRKEDHVSSFNVQVVDASEKNLEQVIPEAAENFNEQSKENSVDDAGVETEKKEGTKLIQDTGQHNSLNNHDFCEDFGFDYEKDSIFTDSEAEMITFGHVTSLMSRSIDSYSDNFLSDGDFDGGQSDIMDEVSQLDAELLQEDLELQNPPEAKTSQFLSEEDFPENSKEAVNGECDDKDGKPMNGSYDSEKLTSKVTCDFDQESNKLETLWEHQDLIEQLKMELRKVRATGLPTILEESESPKIAEDLKPWKIDEKFQRGDCMDELHKFYNSYSERMRKFDIFNYQKMYAIGFFQLKDPLQPISSEKTSGPTLKSLLSQNFWQLKQKGRENKPMIEFMKELQSDLEVVYVGQMCLSWEFLHWQYGKALDLWDSIHRFNEVAGEFQQFQVLMQRFTEDEYFQGPRVQYYAKRRCLLRNLLQVPVIRKDNLKGKRKKKRGGRGEYVISSDMLVEIMEESIRIFWRFVRADKDCSTAISRGHKETLAQLQNPGDLELLMEIKKDLCKKERKLRDLVRSGSCILRRFRRRKEDDSDHVLHFFSQVDLKLVSRVLNMTRITTDQLVWCHSKLCRISFENRKIQVEPSFLLFPC